MSEPARLIDIYTSGADRDTFSTSSVPDLQDFRARSRTLDGILGFTPMFAPVTTGERARLAYGELVTGNYFQVLGVPARLGRTLMADDDAPGATPTAVISESLWRREFAADPGVAGRPLRIRGTPYTVVGVIGSTFNGMLPTLAPELWISVARYDDVTPVGANENVPSPTGTGRMDRRGSRWLLLKGRLKPEATVEQAQGELQVLGAQLATAYPQTNRERRTTVRATNATRIHPELDGTLSLILSGTMLAVGLVLLIACANVAGMLLARASTREREISIRLALGAGRGRLIRQLIVEGVVLGAAGGTVGVMLAWWLTRAIVGINLPIPFPLALNLDVDTRVLLFSAVAAIGTGVLAGLAPALRSTRVDLMTALKGNLTGARAGGRRWTLRDGLVIGQMAVTMLLLVMASLLVRSLIASQHADVGFKSDGLAIVSADTDLMRYSRDRSHQFFDEAIRRVRALPGVQSAAFASTLPFSLNFNRMNIAIPGVQKSPDEMGVPIDSPSVGTDYFKTLGLGIVQGRAIGEEDRENTPPVAVINETMASKYWPAGNAIGQRVFQRTLSSGRSYEITGIVADHKLRTVGESPHPIIYVANAQQRGTYEVIVARTTGDERALLDSMRRILFDMDPGVLLIDKQTMREQVSMMLFPVRAAAALVTVFSSIGLLLAAIGLYGVIAFSVSRRAREIGIRIAIGARPESVLAMVMRQGLTLALLGLIAGGVLAGIVSKVVAGALYGIHPADPIAWSLAASVLLIVAALANYIPAHRAMRVDPSRVLRAE